MTTDHHDWIERVLGFEELEEEERTGALEHLAGCADCRALREGLLLRERAARPMGALPGVGDQRAGIAAEARAEADASLEALLARVRPTRPERMPARPAAPALRVEPEATTTAQPEPVRAPVRSEPPRAPDRRTHPWRHAAWLVPAAAAAVVAVVALNRPAEPPVAPAPSPARPGAPGVVSRPLVPLTDAGPTSLRLERYSGVRSADGGWHTGDAFELRFELPASAYVLVWHVGPAGDAELLFPPAGAVRVPRFGAGAVTLPPVSAPERWVFEGEPGSETFLVATREGSEVALTALGTAVDSALAGITDRTARLLLLETALRERFGEVGRVEAEHLP